MSSSGRRLLYAGVALLAEGVDRNDKYGFFLTGTFVALLAEGVDRNMALGDFNVGGGGRPPRGGRG